MTLGGDARLSSIGNDVTDKRSNSDGLCCDVDVAG